MKYTRSPLVQHHVVELVDPAHGPAGPDDRWRVLTTGKPIWPVPIAAQQVRGAMLVEAALDVGLFGARDRGTRTAEPGSSDRPFDLIVVGAGMCGISACLTALERNLDVLLVYGGNEGDGPADKLFALQSKCPHRWLAPYLYDWPAPHWSRTDWSGQLGWRDGYAATLHDDWYRQFLALTGPLRLEGFDLDPHAVVFSVSQNARCQDHRIECGMVRAHIVNRKNGKSETRHGKVLLFATGFPEEDTRVPLYGRADQFLSTSPYWSKIDDGLTSVNAGCSTKPRVLISGAGDGGQQDLIRLLFGHNDIRAIFDGLFRAAGEPLSSAVRHEAMDIQDVALRRYLVAGPAEDCSLQADLDQRFDVLAGKLHESPRVRQWLGESLRRGDLAGVDLLARCNHLPSCYPLNRLMTLLVRRWFAERASDGEPPMVPAPRIQVRILGGARLASAEPADPTRPGDPTAPHKIHLHFEGACAVDMGRTMEKAQDLETYDRIVLHHGLPATPLKGAASSKTAGAPGGPPPSPVRREAALTRHFLPYGGIGVR